MHETSDFLNSIITFSYAVDVVFTLSYYNFCSALYPILYHFQTRRTLYTEPIFKYDL